MRQFKTSKSITRRNSSSLESYFKEISRIKLLTQEEEIQLVKKAKEGNPRAIEKLVNANLRFVVSVAKQYQHRGLSLPDLISEGNLGLIKAAGRFDVTKGFKFISYAVWWIRQSMLNALHNQGHMIRIPLNKVSELNRIRKATYAFEQQFERDPTLEELSQVMGVPYRDITNSLNASNTICSLNDPLGLNPENNSLEAVLENPDAPSAYDYIKEESLKTDVTRALAKLPPQENNILKMLFGIDTYREFSLEEIGRKYCLTKERVRQIKEKAINKLKKKKDSLSQYINKPAIALN